MPKLAISGYPLWIDPNNRELHYPKEYYYVGFAKLILDKGSKPKSGDFETIEKIVLNNLSPLTSFLIGLVGGFILGIAL